MRYGAANDHPIFEACLTGDAVSVDKYLKDGVDFYENGVVSCAIRGGHLNVLEVFLENGFDVSKPFTKYLITPLNRAIEKKQLHIVRFFLAQGAKVEAELLIAASIFPDAIPVLVNAGADINFRQPKTGRTALMSAAFANQTESLELLLKAGAKIDASDNEGTTPLILASKGGKYEAVEWLLDHGADINAEDNKGKSALDWAKANGHQKIVDLLQNKLGS